MSTSAPTLAVLEVLDELPRPKTGRPLSPDVAALLDALPPHPKWALIARTTDGTERSKARTRLNAVRKQLEFANRSDGLYVRRRPDDLRPDDLRERYTAVARGLAPASAKPKRAAKTERAAATPAEPPAPAADPEPVRKIVGWLGMARAKRMDLFVASYKAHDGKLPAVAAELDISTVLAEQWRRDAKSEGRIRS